MKPWPKAPALYLVSTDGVIWGRLRNKPLHVSIDRDGYLHVLVTVGGRRVNRQVSRIVLETYVGSGDGLQADHVNAVRTDNRLCNLRWLTAAQNIAHRDACDRANRGVGRQAAKLTEANVLEILRRTLSGEPHAAIAQAFGIHKSNVSLISRGLAWRHVTKKLLKEVS